MAVEEKKYIYIYNIIYIYNNRIIIQYIEIFYTFTCKNMYKYLYPTALGSATL